VNWRSYSLGKSAIALVPLIWVCSGSPVSKISFQRVNNSIQRKYQFSENKTSRFAIHWILIGLVELVI